MSENIMPMAWNEPGKGDENKNSWGQGKRNADGPPDLDQVFKDLKRKFKQMFNRGSGGDGGDGSDNNKSMDPNASYKILYFILGILAILYFLFGFYTVKAYEQAVITRLGAYTRTELSGLRWHPLFIEKVYKVNTENIKSSRNSGWMLTKDENIVFVEIEVQYRVMDAEAYLFNILQPDNVLGQAADSALRQVVGDSLTDDVLTDRKQQIADAIKIQLEETLKLYKSGFHIEVVNFRDSRPPEPVKDAFDDVTKSREDRERLKLQAEAYANTLIPEAEGAASRIIAEAQAYKSQVTLNADGEVARFNLIVPGYKRAPQVTRTRMYLDAMQYVFSNTTKILVSNGASNSLMYLPLDKILEKNPQAQSLVPFKGVNNEQAK